MKDTTKRTLMLMARVRLHGLVVVSCLGLALLGRMAESSGGWVSCPPQMAVVAAGIVEPWRRRCKRSREKAPSCGRGGWRWGWTSWGIPAVRSVALWGLWLVSGRWGPGWVVGLPWVLWLWQGVGRVWPGLWRQPEWRIIGWLVWQGQRLALVGYVGVVVGHALRGGLGSGAWGGEASSSVAMGLGCAVCGGEEGRVAVERQADGGYQAEVCGHFSLRVAGDDPFRARVLMLMLRLLEEEGPQRGSRRTRDGRTPFVRQEEVAEWLGMARPHVSRIEGYWLAADWPNLLSLKTSAVLTAELRERVIRVLVAFPWWQMEEVYHYLREQGVAVSYDQVCQVARESGWQQLRQGLHKRYLWSAEDFRPRDDWLVCQLLRMVETLLARLEARGGVTAEEQLVLSEIQTLAREVGTVPAPPLKALPWLLRVEQVLFGEWQAMDDGQVRCIYCGSTHVVRKSKRPRLKKYYDAEGQLQTVAVYRYYCRNPLCDKETFTNLPAGLVLYSPYRTEVKLRAVQMYAWGYSTYRRTGQALGVKSMTVYRWVSAWGYELLPVAALFGVVKSSGVVGVDEKYVLVPKNDKPDGDMRRWMYVYLAVDVYTYDLLHIAIYANNDKDTALAFLLALRAKGYHPRIVVTDLRRDYGPDMARVFPNAVHHECIFHALQDVGIHCRRIYGADFVHTHPEAEELRLAIQHIFAARTKRTAQKRYEAVMALRQAYVQQTAGAAAIFDFLERHWPKLVNGIESQIIPKTNNAVELVIRRFDQHYQSFCGFESIQTAQVFLGVFEKLYRFTPFSDDAQPAIRGKCPLELAGYDICQLPVATLWDGLSIEWPVEETQNDVPNR
jgi:transposase-like protein/transposase